MSQYLPTVSEYVIDQLAGLGLDRVFGVPGDYSFPIDDAIEECPKLEWVVCANELNAAYAADGYARIKGAAILATTYGVGELNALGGLMGSKAHRLPIFHLVGSPSLRIQKQGLIAHHTLGDGVYGNFVDMMASVSGVVSELTAENVVMEMERVILESLRRSTPAYILIPEDQACMPILDPPKETRLLGKAFRPKSAPIELDAVVKAILDRLNRAQTIVALPTYMVARYQLEETLTSFLTHFGISYATTPMDKGILSEGTPGYLGLYNGDGSAPEAVKAAVEKAALVLDIGGVIHEDINTGFWSSELDVDRLIIIEDDSVRIGDDIFTSVFMGDVLEALAQANPSHIRSIVTSEWLEPRLIGEAHDQISSAGFYPRLQSFLKAGDHLVADTGTCMLHLSKLRLPKGVGYQSQTLWGAIGWATPAAMGVAMAAPDHRVILVTGDGAHQITANEVGVMGRYGVRPFIFVLNNGIYGIEDVLNDVGHIYDVIAPWNYSLLPNAMGCRDWFTAKVQTLGELDEVLDRLSRSNQAAYVEVMIPPEESQPLSDAILDELYKTDTPLSVNIR